MLWKPNFELFVCVNHLPLVLMVVHRIKICRKDLYITNRFYVSSSIYFFKVTTHFIFILPMTYSLFSCFIYVICHFSEILTLMFYSISFYTFCFSHIKDWNSHVWNIHSSTWSRFLTFNPCSDFRLIKTSSSSYKPYICASLWNRGS